MKVQYVCCFVVLERVKTVVLTDVDNPACQLLQFQLLLMFLQSTVMLTSVRDTGLTVHISRGGSDVGGVPGKK